MFRRICNWRVVMFFAELFLSTDEEECPWHKKSSSRKQQNKERNLNIVKCEFHRMLDKLFTPPLSC